MKRYTCYVDHCGVDHFHEEPDGEWVKYADALAALVKQTDECKKHVATERTAHEATKAEVVKALGELNLARIRSQAHHNRAEAAEARVAELERDIGAINNEWHAETMRKLKAERAIDQARGLLVEFRNCCSDELRERCRDWLRAHPATSTAAATRAEPCTPSGARPGCAWQSVSDGIYRCECTQKEQGT